MSSPLELIKTTIYATQKLFYFSTADIFAHKDDELELGNRDLASLKLHAGLMYERTSSFASNKTDCFDRVPIQLAVLTHITYFNC